MSISKRELPNEMSELFEVERVQYDRVVFFIFTMEDSGFVELWDEARIPLTFS